MGKAMTRLARFGLEKGVGRLLGANSMFVNRGPFDYTTWSHDETIAATIAVEVPFPLSVLSYMCAHSFH